MISGLRGGDGGGETVSHLEREDRVHWRTLSWKKQEQEQQQQDQGTNENCSPVTRYLVPLSLQGGGK